MGRKQRILLATDLTAGSDRAFDRALQLARSSEATLVVHHAVDTDLLPPRFVRQELREAKNRLEGEIRQAAGAGRRIVAQVSSGEPHEAIVAAAKSAKAQLIVMGAPDYGTASAAFRGTTVDRVVRTAPCPVLTVKTRARKGYETIVVAFDRGEPSRRALECVLRLLPQARASVLHIDETPGDARSRRRDDRTADVRRDVTDLVEACHAAARPLAPRTGKAPTIIIENGVAGDVLQERIERLEPDLVVIGTHGRTGLAKLALGSVAEALLSRLRCDVLVARAYSLDRRVFK